MSLAVKTFAALIAPLLAGGTLALHDTAGRETAASQPMCELVDQPASWVPFSAEMRRIHEYDGSVFVGRDFRASDGSTRNEAGRSFDAITSIAIKNIPQATFYHWMSLTGWTSQPMDMPSWGWGPIPRSMDRRVARVSDTVEGFALLRFESAGRVFYQAPALNLFTLVTRVTCQFDPVATCGTWYSNIRIGEPPAKYFLPPDMAPMVERSDPGGIIQRRPPP